MAGLLNSQAQQEEAPASAKFGEEKATAQEQTDKDKVVNAAMKAIHDDAMHPLIVKMLQDGADNPAEAIATAASQVIFQLDDKSGGKIPETVILPAAEEILVMVYELGEAAGVFTVDAKLEAEAMNATMTKVAEHYGVDPDELQGALESMDPGFRDKINGEQTALLGGGAQQQAAPQQQPGVA